MKAKKDPWLTTSKGLFPTYLSMLARSGEGIDVVFLFSTLPNHANFYRFLSVFIGFCQSILF